MSRREPKVYVLGFYFSPGGVLLIKKLTPAWQFGLCNGIGGGVEPGEDPVDAMVREFKEESGVETAWQIWQRGIDLRKPGVWEMVVFWASGPDLPFRSSCDEGTLAMYKELPPKMEQTARWLCLMLQDKSVRDVMGQKHATGGGEI